MTYVPAYLNCSIIIAKDWKQPKYSSIKGLVKKNDGTSTQWDMMEIRNEEGFHVLYYMSFMEKKAKIST